MREKERIDLTMGDVKAQLDSFCFIMSIALLDAGNVTYTLNTSYDDTYEKWTVSVNVLYQTSSKDYISSGKFENTKFGIASDNAVRSACALFARKVSPLLVQANGSYERVEESKLESEFEDLYTWYKSTTHLKSE